MYRNLLPILALGLAACQPSQTAEPAGPDQEVLAEPDLVAAPDFTGQPDWRAVDPEDLLLIETRDGLVAVELSNAFAPNHAERMRQAVRDGFYDGLTFYRAIDGFVVQGGRGDANDFAPVPEYPELTGEFTVPVDSVEFTPMPDPDHYADQVGHVQGVPAGHNLATGEVWPLHCIGTMAMARAVAPDTGDTEFYIVVGQAPRYLDRNMSVFGRVIDGMEHIQSVSRGDRAVDNGIIPVENGRDPIVSMRIAADLPEADRPAYEVMNSAGAAFHQAKLDYRVRTAEFFFDPPPQVMEACHLPAPARRI